MDPPATAGRRPAWLTAGQGIIVALTPGQSGRSPAGRWALLGWPGPHPADPAAEAPTSTHYERLGVRPSASTDEIRAAYRELAQRLHPDRLGNASPAERRLAERRMREINESWAVLRDSSSRRRYDESRLTGARSRQAPPASTTVVPRDEEEDDDLVDVAPQVDGFLGAVLHHLPWIVLVMLLVGIFVVTAYAANGNKSSEEPATTTTTPVSGTCLTVAAGPVATRVPCSAPHDVRVVIRVDEMTACPAGTERRRLFHDGLLDCVTTS